MLLHVNETIDRFVNSLYKKVCCEVFAVRAHCLCSIFSKEVEWGHCLKASRQCLLTHKKCQLELSIQK